MEPLPISLVASRSFCRRQAWLSLAEGARATNLPLAEGLDLHRRKLPDHLRGWRLEQNLTVGSDRLGLVGVLDAVAWTEQGPLPIEYKRGERRGILSHHLQLAYQALCLEEQLACTVARGFVLHGSLRDPEEVPLDATLRRVALENLSALRAELFEPTAPPPV
ncbi:MAG TPA: CRISPR-associated protein Cas4, partial [Myxococcota bacterium]|nr:CRISPR-associated protein Cas4 [Myxococcota bacterium]